jgi:phosphopantothenoylcysteine synthetase/decarboxylase
MKLLLGITGSIAAYRAADIASTLAKDGFEVDAVLTREALRFVTALTLQSVARRPAYTDETPDGVNGQPTHIALADRADVVLIAPATANILAQMAHGLASDLLTSTLLAVPSTVPIFVAPAMNGKMWLHPATQSNVQTLINRGIQFIGPEEGMLACGYEGIGRLWPVVEICAHIQNLKSKRV